MNKKMDIYKTWLLKKFLCIKFELHEFQKYTSNKFAQIKWIFTHSYRGALSLEVSFF